MNFEDLFSSTWSKLIEGMVQPAALKLFQKSGIKVTESMENVRIQRNGLNKEFDILLVNGDIVIVVEVVSTLKVDDVKDHINDLKIFHDLMPEFKDKKIFGAVGYINVAEEADKYAYRNGLFVVTLTGDNLVEIKNDCNFIPADFSA